MEDDIVSAKKKKKKNLTKDLKLTGKQVRASCLTWLMWLMSTSEKCNKLSRVINVIYDAASGAPLLQDTVLWEGGGGGGGEQREGVRVRGRNWMRGDRGETETSHHNKTSPTNKQVELQAGFSPSLPAWLLSSSKFNSCSVKLWCREAEGGSPLERWSI